jgi:diaminopimelate decarboxylase
MELSQQRYQIGGVDAIQIAERFGAPVYVYDAATM